MTSYRFWEAGPACFAAMIIVHHHADSIHDTYGRSIPMPEIFRQSSCLLSWLEEHVTSVGRQPCTKFEMCEKVMLIGVTFISAACAYVDLGADHAHGVADRPVPIEIDVEIVFSHDQNRASHGCVTITLDIFAQALEKASQRGIDLRIGIERGDWSHSQEVCGL